MYILNAGYRSNASVQDILQGKIKQCVIFLSFLGGERWPLSLSPSATAVTDIENQQHQQYCRINTKPQHVVRSHWRYTVLYSDAT